LTNGLHSPLLPSPARAVACVGGPLADTLGSCGGGKPSFKTQPAFQRMERTHAPLQRFIEAAPYVHRAKKCRHRVTIFPTSAIAPSLKRQACRCLGVVVGLHMIQDLRRFPEKIFL